MPERWRMGAGRPSAAVLRTAVAGRAPVARVPPIVGPAADDQRRRAMAHNDLGPKPDAHATSTATV